MSYKELTAADFADKTPEEIAVLVSDNEKGLKDSRDDWMNQANDFKGKVSGSEQAAADARKVAADKEEERLKAVGDMDGLKLHYEEQLANTTAELKKQTESAQHNLKQRDLSDVHSSVMRGVHENFSLAAQALLDKSTSLTYGEDGKPSATIRLGDKDLSVADFKEAAKTDPMWSAMLKAPDTKGIGATSNTGSQAAGGNANYADMTLQQKADFLRNNPPQRQ